MDYAFSVRAGDSQFIVDTCVTAQGKKPRFAPKTPLQPLKSYLAVHDKLTPGLTVYESRRGRVYIVSCCC